MTATGPDDSAEPELSREELRRLVAGAVEQGRLDPAKVDEALKRVPFPVPEDGEEGPPRWVVTREPER